MWQREENTRAPRAHLDAVQNGAHLRAQARIAFAGSPEFPADLLLREPKGKDVGRAARRRPLNAIASRRLCPFGDEGKFEDLDPFHASSRRPDERQREVVKRVVELDRFAEDLSGPDAFDFAPDGGRELREDRRVAVDERPVENSFGNAENLRVLGQSEPCQRGAGLGRTGLSSAVGQEEDVGPHPLNEAVDRELVIGMSGDEKTWNLRVRLEGRGHAATRG